MTSGHLRSVPWKRLHSIFRALPTNFLRFIARQTVTEDSDQLARKTVCRYMSPFDPEGEKCQKSLNANGCSRNKAETKKVRIKLKLAQHLGLIGSNHSPKGFRVASSRLTSRGHQRSNSSPDSILHSILWLNHRSHRDATNTIALAPT